MSEEVSEKVAIFSVRSSALREPSAMTEVSNPYLSQIECLMRRQTPDSATLFACPTNNDPSG